MKAIKIITKLKKLGYDVLVKNVNGNEIAVIENDFFNFYVIDMNGKNGVNVNFKIADIQDSYQKAKALFCKLRVNKMENEKRYYSIMDMSTFKNCETKASKLYTVLN